MTKEIVLTEIKKVDLVAHDHCNGLCAYRAFIEGVQCTMYGVFLDGSVIGIPSDHMEMLERCGSVLLHSLVALYEMQQDFEPALFTSLDTVDRKECPSGLELMQTLYVALSYYERALETALEAGVSLPLQSKYEHDKDTCVQGRRVLDRFIRGDALRVAAKVYSATMTPVLSDLPN